MAATPTGLTHSCPKKMKKIYKTERAKHLAGRRPHRRYARRLARPAHVSGMLLATIAPLLSALSTSPKVLAVGEALFDSLPAGIFLGGAPGNVAVHLSALGVPAAFCSRVGDDQLGDEIIRRLALHGVNTDFIQVDAEQRTGFVTATLNENGDADYTFLTPAAWDGLEPSETLLGAAARCDVLVLGSLASRLGSRTTIEALASAAAASPATELVFDVNLRAPWYTPSTVLGLGRGVGLLKVNEAELDELEAWLARPPDGTGTPPASPSGDGAAAQPGASGPAGDLSQRAATLGKALDAERVCVTRGDRGALLWCSRGDERDEIIAEHPGFQARREAAADTVGAGDSYARAHTPRRRPLCHSLRVPTQPPVDRKVCTRGRDCVAFALLLALHQAGARG